MEIRRINLSLFFLATGLLSAAIAQEAVVTVESLQEGYSEGESATVCIRIDDENLLDVGNPPTVRISTEESEIGPDFGLLDETVTLVRQEESQCFDIPIIDDSVVEPAESFVVSLSEPNGVTLGADSDVRIFIVNDADLLGLDFIDADLVATEGSTISVCVIITSGSNQHLDGIEADITITDITTNFADYSFLDRTVTFPNGATAGDTMCQNITLALEGEIGENDETFSLQLSPPAVGTSLVDVADTVKTVTIEDADRGRVVVVGPLSVTEGNSGETVLELDIQLDPDIIILNRDVAYTIVLTDGTAEAGSDYQNQPSPSEITFPTGEFGGASSSRTIMIPIIGDEEGEPDETFTLSLVPDNSAGDDGSSVTITIIDDEPKCDDLGNPDNGAVDVSGRYVGAMATYSCNSTYQLIGITTRVCQEGAEWSGEEPECFRGRVVVVGPLSVTEGNSGETVLELDIQLDPDIIILNRDVAYTIVLTDGTAEAGLDYQNQPSPSEITFPTGEFGGASSSRTIMIPIIGDEEGEPNETFTLSLVPDNLAGDDGSSVTITIIDDEPKCDDLGNPDNGAVDVSGCYVGDMATYSCNSTYQLIGITTRVCQEGAEWSGEEPECFQITPSPEITPSPGSRGGGDDSLSAGAIAGIVIAAIIVLILVIILVLLLIICLWIRKKNRSGNYKPGYDTEDQPTKINKADIGEPVAAEDPEPAVAETDLTQSNEMLIN